jgi:hypothetical protein
MINVPCVVVVSIYTTVVTAAMVLSDGINIPDDFMKHVFPFL